MISISVTNFFFLAISRRFVSAFLAIPRPRRAHRRVTRRISGATHAASPDALVRLRQLLSAAENEGEQYGLRDLRAAAGAPDVTTGT